MLKIIKRNEINDEKWNDFIEHSSFPCIYAKTWFLDIVSANWKAIVYFKNDDYQVVMPIPIRTQLGFIKYIAQPTYCQLLGIFSKKEINKDNEFIEFFNQNFKEIIQYQFNVTQSFEATKQYYTHVLSLNDSFETLKKGFSNVRLKNIKVAEKYDWQIMQSTDIKPIINLFKINHEYRLGKVNEATYQLLEQLFAEAHRRGCVELYVAISPITNQIEAGSMFWKDCNRLIYQFCAASKLGQRKEARSLIMQEVIKKYANQPILLDFETTNEDGFRLWNSSYGGQELYFPVYEQVRVSVFISTLKTIWRWLK